MLRIAFLFLILVAGGGAAWFTLAVPEEVETVAAPPPPPEKTKILVATGTMEYGTTITADKLAWRVWPDELLSAGYITRKDRPDAKKELAGSRVRNRFVADEPVLMSKIVTGDTGILAAVLKQGERALAVRVSAENTAGGFVLPGDRVDVLLTRSFTLEDGKEITRSTTILRNVEVLAIDQTAIENEGDTVVGKTATLRLNGPQAEKLATAEASGRLSLALRAAMDREMVEAGAEVEPKAEAAPEPEPEVVALADPKPVRSSIKVRRAGVAETVIVP